MNTRHSVSEAPGLPWPFQPTAPTGDLPDINVWLALAVQEHPHHTLARQYWTAVHAEHANADTVSSRPFIWFCRTTMLGLVRLLCQPKAVGAGALALPAAWGLYQQYRALPQIGLATDPTDCEAQIHSWIGSSPPTAPSLPARLWTDAYFAAMAQTAGLRLVTFDRDFQRFGLTRCLILPTS